MTMERRTSLRRPITLAAKLTLTGDQFWHCDIADFCAEGLFVKYDEEVSLSVREAVQRSPDLKIKVLFTDPSCAKEHTLLVHPVRLIQGAMGVCFIEVDTAAIDAMLSLCAGQGVEKPSVRGESDQASFIIRQCNKSIAEYLEPLLDHYATDVDAALIHAANNASSDKVCNELMDAAGVLKENQSKIRLLTLAAVAAPLKPGHVHENQKTEDNASQLSLIEKNEFEDWLMFKVMVTKAETQYRGALLQLKMRLDKVGIVNHLGYQNPLGPALIVYAFRDVVSQFNLPHIADKTVYRTFETTVIKSLEDLYQSLNQILIRQNILPDLDLSKYLSDRKQNEESEQNKPPSDHLTPDSKDNHSLHAEVADKASAKLNTKASVASISAAANKQNDTDSRQGNIRRVSSALKPSPETQNVQSLEPPFQPQTKLDADDLSQFRAHQRAAQSAYSTINHLFSMLEKSRKVGVQDSEAVDRKDPNAPKWSHDELKSGLDDMQANSSKESSAAVNEVPPLIRRLKEKLESRTGTKKALSQDQEDVVDVVDRFFVSMKTSQKLTEVTKSQLTQLEVPVLKVLMRNKEFFEDVDSPVRAVLNRVAQLGIKGGRPNPANQKKIEGIIQRINNEFEQDTSVFDEVLGELDELVDRQNLLYRRNVERVAAAAEGSQKVVQAKKVVARQIEKRIAGRKVPKAVVSLINGGWQDLLSLTYIRQGDQSQAWQDYLGVLDSLLAYGDDPDLDINLTDLLKIIQEGLSSISSNHMPSGHIRDELKRFLVGSKTAQVEMIEMPAEQSFGEQGDISLLTESRHRGMQRWVLRAQKLELGDWLKYTKDPENPQYMRLVWVGKGFSKFVFVNHQGMKVVELDLMTVAGYLQKEIAVLEKDYEVPIVDESLDNMVKQVYNQLSFATTHDELTGLVNRKEFERNIESLLGQGDAVECSLLYLDLRQFRIVNDAAGYEAGDQILKDVSKLLLDYAPKGAVVARLGGNEFGVLVRHPSVDGLAKQYVRQIHEYQFKWDEKTYQLAVCIGVASANEVASNTDRLLKVAEEACRRAKLRGPNKVDHYAADESNLSQQAQIKAKVAGFSNLNDERTLLRCQKIIPLQSETRVKTHYEILLSVYDDRGHLIPAYEFVRTAEKYNRMQAVDRWVVGHMLDWMSQHSASLDAMGGIAINLSGHSLNDEELLEFIYHRLSEYDAPLEKLWFEITEAAAISNVHSVADFMNELKEIGCHFCLGNFGAGMSSYHFLKELPVDMIKIDGTFIKNLTSDEGDRAMVRSMTEMVHFMGKELVATQVEDMQCLELLTSLGVDYAQGYVIEKPRLLSNF
ncbi:DUF1631 family protein [Alkalimarinus coralli]|uniref:DUF1631 family protein n=1 Tax=Alkalimarinus coralli TaxID=2935863 RepID=UPI00202B1427|nr:DUF1631 family protein [Alkalimarinus coralli]